MEGVGWIGAIIVSGLAGWIAEKVMKSDAGLLTNIILGIVGAVVLNAILMAVLGYTLAGWIGQLVVGAIGACLLIFIYRARDAEERASVRWLRCLTVPRPRHPEKVGRPSTPLLRKPDWIRVKAPGSAVFNATRAIVRENGLVTVCEEASCAYRRVLVAEARDLHDIGRHLRAPAPSAMSGPACRERSTPTSRRWWPMRWRGWGCAIR